MTREKGWHHPTVSWLSKPVPSVTVYAGGLWPMMRRVSVSGATRAPRCRGWHEVLVYFAKSHVATAHPFLAEPLT
eukprot:4829355-Prymnesium_polylepis.1